MDIILGWIIILVSLIVCWAGQVVNALSPRFAAHLGLCSPESDVDPAFYADGRGLIIWFPPHPAVDQFYKCFKIFS